MKKNILILTSAIAFLGCKKADEPTPEPAPVTHMITAKVNGIEKVCDNAFFSSSSGGSLKGSYFYLDGFNESIYIGYKIAPGAGKHQLKKYGEPNVVYFNNNAQFHAVSGTLNVTSVDTSQSGGIKGLVGTLDFKTDTASASGSFFSITEVTFNIKL